VRRAGETGETGETGEHTLRSPGGEQPSARRHVPPDAT